MKKRLMFSLTLSIGLLIICYPVFACSDGFQQIHELNSSRATAYIRLFISIAALLLLFYPNSLLSGHLRDLRRGTSFTPFKQALTPRLGKGTAFGIDTGILMHYPEEIFEVLGHETVLISCEVQNELKMLTNSLDKTVSANVRRAIKAVEAAQLNGHLVNILPATQPGTLKGLGLGDTTDDRIVAAYLIYAQDKGSTCLISNDRGVKRTAGNTGLAVLEGAETSSVKRMPSKLFGAIILFMVLLAGSAGYNLLIILSLL